MRCLTLADALRSQGVEATFVTRKHPGNLIQAITGSGYRVISLSSNPSQPYGAHPAPPPHACWLAADWRSDAASTRAALEKTGASWLVMDHYALDVHWQDAALLPGVSLLVLDDLADRPHCADVLLDQNLGRSAQDYTELLPANCDLRIGPVHALLRPEFARLRPAALSRRNTLSQPKTLLVTLGGIDIDNSTSQVLDALAEISVAQELQVTVVMGVGAPNLDTVRARAETMKMSVDVVTGVSDMGERMMQADLCIGAVGSTAWERCALGLPTLQVVLADNQRNAAQAMAERGFSITLPEPNAEDFACELALGLEQLWETSHYRAMARATSMLTDGGGARWLAERLLEGMQGRENIHAH